MRQMGFLVDTKKCVGCNSCRVACQVKNGTSPLVNWRHVGVHEQGTFPNVGRYSLSLACNHCEHPACIEACPVNAIEKRSTDGVVHIDQASCNGCTRCVSACPYGAPRMDPASGKAGKCHMCMDRLDAGQAPHCVETCLAGALQFGYLDELEAREGAVRGIEGFPEPDLTNPSTRFIV